MDGRNVTELTELTTVSDTDNVLIGQDNTLKRVSFANLKTVLKTIIGNATTTVAGLMAAADKQHLDALQTKLGSITVDTTLQDSATSLPTGSAVKGALTDYDKIITVNVSGGVGNLTDTEIEEKLLPYVEWTYAGTGIVRLAGSDGSARSYWYDNVGKYVMFEELSYYQNQPKRYKYTENYGWTVYDYALKSDLTDYVKIINRTVDYASHSVLYNADDYLNDNVDIFCSGWQMSNIPIPSEMTSEEILMINFSSRGENLSHNQTQGQYRNIQNIEMTYYQPNYGWITRKYRRFAIDTTVFSWQLLND